MDRLAGGRGRELDDGGDERISALIARNSTPRLAARQRIVMGAFIRTDAHVVAAADKTSARRQNVLKGAAADADLQHAAIEGGRPDRKSTRLNSSHRCISYAVFRL